MSTPNTKREQLIAKLSLLRGKTSRIGMCYFRRSRRGITYPKFSRGRWMICCAIDSGTTDCHGGGV